MKTESNYTVLGSDYCTTTNNNDMYDAIALATERMIKMKEEKVRGVVFHELAENLKRMGIMLTEIKQEPFSATEIKAYIDYENYIRFLEKKGTAKEPIKIKYPAKKPIPKKVIFSGPATTILWKDGTKTTVKCQEGDEWTPDVGIAMCYLKKMLGNKGNYNKIFREAEKVSEVQYKKEDLNATKTVEIENDSYYSSALDSMKRNINEINDFMKNAAEALDKALGGKK